MKELIFSHCQIIKVNTLRNERENKPKPKNLTGKVYNNIEVFKVLEEPLNMPDPTYYYKCKCKRCGKMMVVKEPDLPKMYCLCPPPLAYAKNSKMLKRVNSYDMFKIETIKSRDKGITKFSLYLKSGKSVYIDRTSYWYVSQYYWREQGNQIITTDVPDEIKTQLHMRNKVVKLRLDRLIYCNGDVKKALTLSDDIKINSNKGYSRHTVLSNATRHSNKKKE